MFRNIPLPKFLANSAGFTLMEVAVATALLGMGISLVGSSVFHVLNANRYWEEQTLATKDLRHVGSWFAGDALNTASTDLNDSAPAVSTVALTLFNGDTVTYSLSGQDLMRSHDNGSVVVTHPLAAGVTAVTFARSGKLVTMNLQVQSDRGGTDSISLDTSLR